MDTITKIAIGFQLLVGVILTYWCTGLTEFLIIGSMLQNIFFLFGKSTLLIALRKVVGPLFSLQWLLYNPFCF